jgi:hypothetical protein
MIDPRQFGTIAVPAKKLRLNNNLVDRTEKSSMDSFGREYNIFTNVVQWHMCFSFTAKIAWSGWRMNAFDIALLVKGYSILIGQWASILACRDINNNHSLKFPPLSKSSDLSFWFLHHYQFLRWALSCTILWAGRLLWCGSCSFITLPLRSCNLRCCCCHPWTLLLQVKTSSFIDSNWQNGLKTITTSFFLWRCFLSFGLPWHAVLIGEFEVGLLAPSQRYSMIEEEEACPL